MLEGVIAYVGIGSNLCNSLENCKDAIAKLSGISGITIEKVSSFYKTEPVILDEAGDQQAKIPGKENWFINAVLEIRTTLSARDLLKVLQKIENNMGRVRTFKGSPRTIDLDLLLYGQEIIQEDELIVPHPQMHRRRFVLEPLCEIASYGIHPGFGVSIRGLKERLNDTKVVERYEKSSRRLL